MMTAGQNVSSICLKDMASQSRKLCPTISNIIAYHENNQKYHSNVLKTTGFQVRNQEKKKTNAISLKTTDTGKLTMSLKITFDFTF